MSRKKIGTLRDCVCNTGGGGSGTSGIAGVGDVTIRVDTPEVVPAVSTARAPKPRKPRSKGKGDFCVLSYKGKVVHCYEDESTAQKVAASFSKRGKSGTKFHVGPRNK